MPINVHTPYQNVDPLEKYPNKIDDDIVLPFVDENNPSLPPGLTPYLWNDLNYAIKSIEAELGILPSGGFSSIADRLNFISNLNDSFAQINQDLGGTGIAPLVIGINGSPIDLTSPFLNNQVLVYRESDGYWVSKSVGIDFTKPPFTIKIDSSTASILQLGQSLTTPSFIAEYTVQPSEVLSATLSNSENSVVENVISTPTSFSTTQSFTSSNSSKPLTFGSEIIFTLTSSPEDNPLLVRQKNVSFKWGQKVYWGVAAIPGSYNQGFIESLEATVTGGSEVALTKNRVLNVIANSGEYIFFACRSGFDVANFLVNDFEGGFTVETNSVSVTNDFGFTENYTIYRSDNSNLGVTSVLVF